MQVQYRLEASIQDLDGGVVDFESGAGGGENDSDDYDAKICFFVARYSWHSRSHG